MHAGHGGILFPDTLRRVNRRNGHRRGEARTHVFCGQRRGGHALKQQRLNGPYSAVCVKTALHGTAMEHVVQRQQSHALVVRHVGVNHHTACALAGVFPCEIHGVVEPHGPFEAQLPQPFQVIQRGTRIYQQTQHSGIGCHHVFFIKAGPDGQRGNAERMVLICLV